MAERQAIDVTRLVDEQKIGSFHLTLIALAFLVMLSDGYDLQAASLAGPGLVQQWHVNPGDLGTMFSASLFGMMFGGPLFAWIGDRSGRRVAIISGSLLYGAVTLLAAYASSLGELTALRFVAGLGLGGLPANCIALTAESAPKRVRATLIVLMYLGITVGSMMPAWTAAWMGSAYRWETLFVIGGIAPIAIAGLLWLLLPESIKFLALKRPDSPALPALVRRLRPDLLVTAETRFVMPDADDRPQNRLLVERLFQDRLGAITLLIWLLYILILMCNFFLHSWMPILFRSGGLSIEAMGTATAMYDVGGIVGALLISRLIDKWGMAALAGYFLLACPLVAAIGLPGLSLAVLSAFVFLSGFCIVGILLGLSAAVGLIYPTRIRATGAGWASAVGRFGAIGGPMIGGWLIAMHVSVQDLFLAPVLPLAIGTLAALLLMQLCRRRFRGGSLGEEAAAIAPAAGAGA